MTQLSKSGLVNALMLDGQENLAVLVAHSELPETLSLDRDREVLDRIGMSADDMATLATWSSVDAQEVSMAEAGRAYMRQVVSDRYADLVDNWLR